MNIFNILSVQSMFRYEELTNIIYNYKKLKPGDTINVFINLEYMITNLLSSRFCNVDKELAVSADMKSIISDIFSIVSHYRNFFIYYNVYPKIYLYLTSLDSDITKFVEYELNKNYRKRYRLSCKNELSQATLDTFRSSFSVIQNICNYIDDVYFVVSENIDSSLVPLILSKVNATTHNMIISYDDMDDIYYSAQYTIRIKVKRKDHKRIGVTSLANILASEYKTNEFQLYHSNILFLSALIGCKNRENIRCIPNILRYGPATLSKDIIKGINDGLITMRTNSIELFKNCINDEYRNNMENVIKQIDPLYRLNKISDASKRMLSSQLINLYDVEGLKFISNKLFNEYQLDIYNLLKKPKFMLNRR